VPDVSYPNTLILVDIPTPDPAATGKFYAEVFGWTNEGRPDGVFHRLVPGDEFQLDDGSPSGVGNLHIGIYETTESRPDPNVPPFANGQPTGAQTRMWVLVSDDDSQDAILERAEARGAKILWKDAYWGEFNGFHAAFVDPWGVQIVLWTKGGDDPQIPEHFHKI
jgi:predicted enzyme related to lactoylglutathione lyase